MASAAMTVLLEDTDVTLHVGDAVEVLRTLPDRSVHCVLTSPPFYGLRDYRTGTWEGGDAECDHAGAVLTRHGGWDGNNKNPDGSARTSRYAGTAGRISTECKCGARRVDQQIGLEDTPDLWAARLVEVFRECRRVLRDDGTLWVEIGDSYAGSWGAQSRENGSGDASLSAAQIKAHPKATRTGSITRGVDFKPKDLIGAPFLLAFALRNDGWYWRGNYIWEKPDAMPESATDRCTVSHSYLLHFSKRARYYHDQDAIREAFSGAEELRSGRVGAYQDRAMNGNGDGTTPRWTATKALPSQLNLDGEQAEPERRGPDGRRVTTVQATHNSEQHRDGERWPNQGRNARSVWRITTEATSFGLCPVCRTYWDSGAPAKHCGVDTVAHFATWPHALAGRIIACATSERGCCPECGAPWERETERTAMVIRRSGVSPYDHHSTRASGRMLSPPSSETTGWLPSCDCSEEDVTVCSVPFGPVPCRVLDPFAGSGTTARQARLMGRHTILIELSPDYAEIAANRLSQLSLLA